jgi:hypothetical protein
MQLPVSIAEKVLLQERDLGNLSTSVAAMDGENLFSFAACVAFVA